MLTHATCVAVARRTAGAPQEALASTEPASDESDASYAGVLIRGPSGAGKSSLALMMMAMGAELVADDQVSLSLMGDAVSATAPTRLAGLIEARGVGLIRAPHRPRARLAWVVELDADPTLAPASQTMKSLRRLPEPAETSLYGRVFPLVYGWSDHVFAATMVTLARCGELLDPNSMELGATPAVAHRLQGS